MNNERTKFLTAENILSRLKIQSKKKRVMWFLYVTSGCMNSGFNASANAKTLGKVYSRPYCWNKNMVIIYMTRLDVKPTAIDYAPSHFLINGYQGHQAANQGKKQY